MPDFLDPVRDRIRWDDSGRFLASPTFAVDHSGDEVFVQNAEEHTHGFVAPDLGMGAMRSSVILAQVLGREPYAVEKRIAFQEFGASPTATGTAHHATMRLTIETPRPDPRPRPAARLGDAPALGLLGHAGRDARGGARRVRPDRATTRTTRPCSAAPTASRLFLMERYDPRTRSSLGCPSCAPATSGCTSSWRRPTPRSTASPPP